MMLNKVLASRWFTGKEPYRSIFENLKLCLEISCFGLVIAPLAQKSVGKLLIGAWTGHSSV
jgi:hypothetical protein